MKDEINFDRSLNMMGREVSHLPSAKGSRRAALRSADEALAETEGIAAKVSEMVRAEDQAGGLGLPRRAICRRHGQLCRAATHRHPPDLLRLCALRMGWSA